jgi:prephenate dehydratase
MKIAIQGEPGSFSHEATLAMLPEAMIVPCTVSADVFKALTEGSVDGAVIPIENSLAGSVLEHFDLLLQPDVPVVRHAVFARQLCLCPDRARTAEHGNPLRQCGLRLYRRTAFADSDCRRSDLPPAAGVHDCHSRQIRRPSVAS